MRTLRVNARGDDVKVWQTFLKSAGFYEGIVDGAFGPKTVAATQGFQRANTLVDDGVVGNRTLGKAMQLGLDLIPEDAALPGDAQGAAFVNDAWLAPPPPNVAGNVVARDPRVVTNHAPGQLPCPSTPPPPVGWAYWRGNLPAKFVNLAVEVQTHSDDYPMGTFVQAFIDGQVVAARVEWHDFQGSTGKHGCFRGTSLFRPRGPLV